ncbi:hypothetical protein EYC80_002469 [Monilinia laxa]|nr:hypothetical protein EYC80_002469 [Monilinia laxa]
MQRVDVDRMHLTQDENGKIVCRRRDEEQGFEYEDSRAMVARRLEEEEMSLTRDQKETVMSSEYHAGGLEEIPEYHTSGRLEEIPEYNANGSLQEIPEYHTIGDKENIPMTRFHAI